MPKKINFIKKEDVKDLKVDNLTPNNVYEQCSGKHILFDIKPENYSNIERIDLNEIKFEECIKGMSKLPDNSVDLILCDLPYGTTNYEWDAIIPFDLMWEQYNRVVRPNGTIVLFGVEPFSSMLRCSNIKNYAYDWVWNKEQHANFQQAKKQPLKQHEYIHVFRVDKKAKGLNSNKGDFLYQPPGMTRINKELKVKRKAHLGKMLGSEKRKSYIQEFTDYPKSILHFPKESTTFHHTQKPVELLKYLIKTYTHPGSVVLDNCMGSGSTAIACLETNRFFVGFEMNEENFITAQRRICTYMIYKIAAYNKDILTSDLITDADYLLGKLKQNWVVKLEHDYDVIYAGLNRNLKLKRYIEECVKNEVKREFRIKQAEDIDYDIDEHCFNNCMLPDSMIYDQVFCLRDI